MSQDTSAIDSLLGLNLDQPAADQPLPKPRKRINNLNESHFLGIKGLSYIKKNQKQIRSKLNHKDDYKNLTNLLNFYQLWGHSIYPKANFKDFLDMTVKVGSKSKLLKRQRQDWLNQEMGVEKYSSLENGGLQQDIDNPQDNANSRGSDDEMNNNNNDDDDDDQVVKQRSKGNRLFVAEDESDDDDDLYAVPKRRVEKLLSQGDNEVGKDNIEKENTEDREEEDKENKDPHTQKKGLQDFNDDFEDDDDDDFDQILDKPAPPPPTQHQPEEDPDAVMRELQQPQPQDEYDEDEIEYEIMREAGF